MREWDSYRSAVVNEKEIGQTRFPDRIRRLIEVVRQRSGLPREDQRYR